MATENPRVWFKSISLENVRSFGTKQTINFTDKDGNAARWNVILGDNGTGKTTVLKGLYLAVQEAHSLYYSNVSDKGLARFNTKGSVRVEIIKGNASAIFGFNLKYPKIYISSIIGRIKIQLDSFEFISNNLETDSNVNIYGYGAARKMGQSSLTVDTNDQEIVNLFDENSTLLNVEEWIIQAEYLSLKDKRLQNRFELIKSILLRLFREEIFDFYITTDNKVPVVFFKTHYGDVRLHELSLGYKTLIAWMVDFAKGLLDRYPDSKDPLSEPAVCLVDELDLHLHPKFQRTIIQFLTETFPNTQFIVTAHSPLIVQAAEEYNVNLILLKREGDETVVVNDPVDVRNWRLDQILSSELFNVEDPATKLRRERDQLLAKKKLTKEEQNRLQKLNADLDAVPFSSDPVEVKAETIIHQLAEALRSRMQPHDTN